MWGAMSIRLWMLLTLTWVSIVGGGWLATHWVRAGQFELPNVETVALDDAHALGEDCETYYPQHPESVGEEGVDAEISRCWEVRQQIALQRRLALVRFLGTVFGPPLAVGFLAIVVAALRKSPTA
jgi:hypothetical protein